MIHGPYSVKDSYNVHREMQVLSKLSFILLYKNCTL